MKPTPLVPLLALALALAGCVAAPDGPDAEDADAGGTDSTREAWLTAEMGFADESPSERAAVRAGSFYADWAQGTDYPTWESDPMPSAVRVVEMRIDLAFDVSAPVLQSPRFPDVMAYGGAGGSWIGFNSTRGDDPALTPGQTYRWTVPLALPEGGLWIPAGERLGLKIVPVMLQNDQSDFRILVGGEDGSRVAWTQAPGIETPPLTQGEGATGETVGSAYAGAAAPASTSHRTTIPLGADARALLVWMNTTAAQGVPDIDMAVQGPDGADVASSGTPTPREFIRLGPDNLRGPGDYTVLVTSYGSARATFTVEWATG